ncbi:hypothetical protein [Sphingomonas japonica]|uniref:Fe-S oxidoreductase n=1 Tax=Sphingomonas japonica TaxID=511662 RepID=A0ABX0TX85_9SPHN|nr:hypothetical protein [Sphingomonas japonica]NIJ22921.1 hypothetical protein [Sphingomonas japonica]
MKYLALATALALSGTAIAQTTTTPPPATQDGMAQDSMTQTQDGMAQDDMDSMSTTPPMTQDNTVPPATNMPPSTPPTGTPPSSTMPMNQPMTSMSGDDPAGGYMPSQPALSGPATAGATVRFQPSPSPDQAFPAPAPLAEYPVCKAGQTDGCRNRGE